MEIFDVCFKQIREYYLGMDEIHLRAARFEFSQYSFCFVTINTLDTSFFQNIKPLEFALTTQTSKY